MLLRNHTGFAAECFGYDAKKTVLFPYIFNAKAWVSKKRIMPNQCYFLCASGAGYMVVGGGCWRVDSGVERRSPCEYE